MLRSKMRAASAACSLAMWVVGCAQESDEREPVGGADAYVARIDDELEARAFQREPSLVQVELRRAGALTFEAQFLSDGQQGQHVAFTYHPPTWDEGNVAPLSSELELGGARIPSLAEAVDGAVLIHAQLESAVLGNYDSWGCDLLPGRYNWVASCGPKGGCCDAHDACYAQNNCRAWSFASAPWTRCTRTIPKTN